MKRLLGLLSMAFLVSSSFACGSADDGGGGTAGTGGTGGEGGGTGGEGTLPPPTSCEDPWQDWTFEAIGGDPTGTWDILLDCSDGWSEITFYPPCEGDTHGTARTTVSVLDGFLAIGEGQITTTTTSLIRNWMTIPQACIAPGPGAFERGCQAQSGPNAYGVMGVCGVIEEIAECHCYFEYVLSREGTSAFLIDGTNLTPPAQVPDMDVFWPFSVAEDTLFIKRGNPNSQGLMIARSRSR